MADSAITQQLTQYPSGMTEYSIFVGDLALSTTSAELLEVFQDPRKGLRPHLNNVPARVVQPFESLSGAYVMLDREGRSRGFGFVRFTTFDDQRRALKSMSGLYCGERPMRIAPATARQFALPSGAALASAYATLTNNEAFPNPDTPLYGNQTLPSLDAATTATPDSSRASPESSKQEIAVDTFDHGHYRTPASNSFSAPREPPTCKDADSTAVPAVKDLATEAEKFKLWLQGQAIEAMNIRSEQQRQPVPDLRLPLISENRYTASTRSVQQPSAPLVRQNSAPAQHYNHPSYDHPSNYTSSRQPRHVSAPLMAKGIKRPFVPNVEEEEATSKDLYNTTVFIGNLNNTITEELVRNYFAQFGAIHYIRVPRDKHCAFVQFVRKEDARNAIETCQGAFLGKCKMRLTWGRSGYTASKVAETIVAHDSVPLVTTQSGPGWAAGSALVDMQTSSPVALGKKSDMSALGLNVAAPMFVFPQHSATMGRAGVLLPSSSSLLANVTYGFGLAPSSTSATLNTSSSAPFSISSSSDALHPGSAGSPSLSTRGPPILGPGNMVAETFIPVARTDTLPASSSDAIHPSLSGVNHSSSTGLSSSSSVDFVGTGIRSGLHFYGARSGPALQAGHDGPTADVPGGDRGKQSGGRGLSTHSIEARLADQLQAIAARSVTTDRVHAPTAQNPILFDGYSLLGSTLSSTVDRSPVLSPMSTTPVLPHLIPNTLHASGSLPDVSPKEVSSSFSFRAKCISTWPNISAVDAVASSDGPLPKSMTAPALMSVDALMSSRHSSANLSHISDVPVIPLQRHLSTTPQSILSTRPGRSHNLPSGNTGGGSRARVDRTPVLGSGGLRAEHTVIDAFTMSCGLPFKRTLSTGASSSGANKVPLDGILCVEGVSLEKRVEEILRKSRSGMKPMIGPVNDEQYRRQPLSPSIAAATCGSDSVASTDTAYGTELALSLHDGFSSESTPSLSELVGSQSAHSLGTRATCGSELSSSDSTSSLTGGTGDEVFIKLAEALAKPTAGPIVDLGKTNGFYERPSLLTPLEFTTNITKALQKALGGQGTARAIPGVAVMGGRRGRPPRGAPGSREASARHARGATSAAGPKQRYELEGKDEGTTCCVPQNSPVLGRGHHRTLSSLGGQSEGMCDQYKGERPQRVESPALGPECLHTMPEILLASNFAALPQQGEGVSPPLSTSHDLPLVVATPSPTIGAAYLSPLYLEPCAAVGVALNPQVLSTTAVPVSPMPHPPSTFIRNALCKPALDIDVTTMPHRDQVTGVPTSPPFRIHPLPIIHYGNSTLPPPDSAIVGWTPAVRVAAPVVSTSSLAYQRHSEPAAYPGLLLSTAQSAEDRLRERASSRATQSLDAAAMEAFEASLLQAVEATVARESIGDIPLS